VKAISNPGRLRLSDFGGLRGGVAEKLEQFYKVVAVPFLGHNEPGAKASERITEQFSRPGIQSSAIGS
jgi:hypothetical protein